jgi:hypothetical protein
VVADLINRLTAHGFWVPYTPAGDVVYVTHPDGGPVLPVAEDPWVAGGLLLHISKDPAIPEVIGMAGWAGGHLPTVLSLTVRQQHAVVFVDAECVYTLLDHDDPALTSYADVVVTEEFRTDIDVWFDTRTRSWSRESRTAGTVSLRR